MLANIVIKLAYTLLAVLKKDITSSVPQLTGLPFFIVLLL